MSVAKRCKDDKMSTGSSSRIPKIPRGENHSVEIRDSSKGVKNQRIQLPKTFSQSKNRLKLPQEDAPDTDSPADSTVDGLSSHGFIKLNTHDVSSAQYHVSGIEQFADDLQSAITAAWPTRRSSRYERAHVLLLSWENDNLGVHREIRHLEYVFSNLYRFNVESFKIPPKTAGKATTSRILSFLEDDGPETLFIVYYAGHARLSHRSSEPPIWSATDKPNSPTLPSGGVQQLFEEAEADVLLLYDTCHSSHPAVNIGGQGVTEVIAACGFETEAPAVGPHSFTNALIRELEEAFTGPPISVAELHGRIIGSLKSWKPGLLRDMDGNVWTDENGQPRYECHKRRTPVHCFLTNESPYRSIMLAPLQSKLSHFAVARIEQSTPQPSTATTSLNASQSTSISGQSTAPTTVSGSSTGTRGPRVLLAVRLEDDYFIDDELSDSAKKLQVWCDWVRSAPDGIKDISVQGIYKSFSTLVLISVPVVVWDILPDNPAYSFVGFVQSENLADIVSNTGQAIVADVPTDAKFKSTGNPSLTTTQQSVNRDSGFSEVRDVVEMPLILTDATGRQHKIPYQLCDSWGAFDRFIKASFPITDTTGKAIHQGHYQIVDEYDTTILPQTFNKFVLPGSSIKMQIWQGPVHSRPLTPPPVRGFSPSPRKPIANESLKRQRTLKRRAGFVLPKQSLEDKRPPSPEDSSDERFEVKRKEATALANGPIRQVHPPNPKPSQKHDSQIHPLDVPPSLMTNRQSYPTTTKVRDTSRFATWSGFSKTSSQHIFEKTKPKAQIKPARARSLQEKVTRDTTDQYTPRRSLSAASQSTVGVHRLRKEKGYLMLKSQLSGSTLRAASANSRHSESRISVGSVAQEAPSSEQGELQPSTVIGMI